MSTIWLIFLVCYLRGCCGEVKGNCGTLPSQYVSDKVVNGLDFDKGGFPWIVSIGMSSRKAHHICGGSIISEDWVITAAHCVFSSSPKDYLIHQGLDKITKGGVIGGQEVKVDQIKVHPKFDRRKLSDDLALFHLETPIDVSGNGKEKYPAGTICLATAEREKHLVSNGSDAISAGWGQTNLRYHNPKMPEQLQKTKGVVIFDNKACNDYISSRKNHLNHPRITDCHVCLKDKDANRAHKKQTNVHRGDSGGALVCKDEDRYFLCGIVSFGFPFDPSLPSTFVKLSCYAEWIKEITGVSFQ